MKIGFCDGCDIVTVFRDLHVCYIKMFELLFAMFRAIKISIFAGDLLKVLFTNLINYIFLYSGMDFRENIHV